MPTPVSSPNSANREINRDFAIPARHINFEVRSTLEFNGLQSNSPRQWKRAIFGAKQRIQFGNQGMVRHKWIDGTTTKIKSDMAIIVPAGARQNTGEKPLKLNTFYAPPEHVDGTVHATKADAAASEEHFDGKTTE